MNEPVNFFKAGDLIEHKIIDKGFYLVLVCQTDGDVILQNIRSLEITRRQHPVLSMFWKLITRPENE